MLLGDRHGLGVVLALDKGVLHTEADAILVALTMWSRQCVRWPPFGGRPQPPRHRLSGLSPQIHSNLSWREKWRHVQEREKALKTRGRSRPAALLDRPPPDDILLTASPKSKVQAAQKDLYWQSTATALKAYMEACHEAQLDRLMLPKLSYYLRERRTVEQKQNPLPSHGLFEMVLRALADRGDLDSLVDVWRLMTEHHVILTPAHFVYAMVGIGKSDGRDEDFMGDMAAQWKEAFGQEAELLVGKERTYFEEGLHKCGRTVPSPSYESAQSVTTYLANPLLNTFRSRDASLLQPQTRDSEAAMEMALQRQESLERRGYAVIPSVLSLAEPPEAEGEAPRVAQRILEQWREDLIEKFSERIDGQLAAKARIGANFINCYPFFKILSPGEYVDLLLHQVSRLLKMSETHGASTPHIKMIMGTKVMRKVQMYQYERSGPMSNYRQYLDWFRQPGSVEGWCHREAYLKRARHPGRDTTPWPPAIRRAIGGELLNLLLHHMHVRVDREGHLIVDDNTIVAVDAKGKLSLAKSSPDASGRTTCPAFFRIFRRQQDMYDVECLKALPALGKLFAVNKLFHLEFDSSALPMVVPPLPWFTLKDGGYLLTEENFVRALDIYHVVAENDSDTLRPIFDSVNQLGSTAWRVNEPILDIILEVFNNQSQYEDLLSTLSIPKHQDLLSPPQMEFGLQERLSEGKVSGEEYNNFLVDQAAHSQVKAECYSLWCDALYRLSIAHAFRKDTIYFPHNIDFRGRVYPIAPHFNHMSADLARSLLVFALGRPLGPKGLEWLKLHTVNLTGIVKKASIPERLSYAEEHLSDMLDSANHPLHGDRWWMKSEDPWQTLAACIELRNALNSDNPEDFISHLPIHQDGSCNGLQHYAALGRDSMGAKYVNVLPSERPQDVYGEIAAIVEKKREKDAREKNLEIATMLEGFVTRKVVKQTVMTTVYGVTEYGARLQIAKRLKEMDHFPKESVKAGATYLAKNVFLSLNEAFRSSQQIQHWLTECVNVISRDLGLLAQWDTPLGLNVVQPYIKTTKPIQQNIGDELCRVDYALLAQLHSKPNVMKQRNGFPPNYVHSLDSTHMMLTSMHMWHTGQIFASVHDCYWTHAASVEKMNFICRQQFVNLHSQPLLENLSRKFFQQHEQLRANRNSATRRRFDEEKAKILFRSVPKKGDLELEQVKSSTFFFS